MSNLILTVDLVPETSFYNNLRKVVSKSTWDKLRKQTYSRCNVSCGICGVKDVVLDCHEIWEYDEENLTQRLAGLIALCRPCHNIKHHGYANILAHQGKLNMDDLIAHFMRVNKCTKEEYKSHVKEAFQQWTERSKKQWTVDLGEYAQYVTSTT